MGTGTGPFSGSLAGRIVINEQTEQLTVLDDSNNPVALMGKDSTGSIVMKVAMSGQNAITASDDQLIFNSNQDTFKIVATGTLTATKGASLVSGGNAIAFPNVGNTAFGHLSFYDAGSGTGQYFGLPDILLNDSTGAIMRMIHAYTELAINFGGASGIYYTVEIRTPSNAGALYTSALSYPVRYYILQETAS